MVKADLSPVWVSEGDDVTEVLVVEIHIEERKIRILNCYGPQSGDSIERKNKFWSREIKKQRRTTPVSLCRWMEIYI